MAAPEDTGRAGAFALADTTAAQPADSLSITVNQAAQDEIATCAAMAAAVEMFVGSGSTLDDEYARALTRELARRMQGVYMNAFTPDAEVGHG